MGAIDHGTPYQLRDLGVRNIAVLVTSRAADDPATALAPGIADAVFQIDDVEPASPRPLRAGLRWSTGGEGLSVASVRDASPASRAGLVPGDRVTAIAGKIVASVADAEGLLRRMPPGTQFPVVVQRGDTAHDIIVRLQTGDVKQ